MMANVIIQHYTAMQLRVTYLATWTIRLGVEVTLTQPESLIPTKRGITPTGRLMKSSAATNLS